MTIIITSLISLNRYKTDRLASCTPFLKSLTRYRHTSRFAKINQKCAVEHAVFGLESVEMGLSCRKWFILSVCITGIYGYNVQRLDDDKGQRLEIDFFSSIETNKFLDNFRKSESEPDDMFLDRNVDSTKPPANNDSTPLDSWSVVWYIASFGGLIVFFLIVSCSEWCCRRAIRNSQNCNRTAPTTTTPTIPDTPPPSYDQFAPPSYESICLGRNGRGGEKSEYDIFVVPVHALGPIIESNRQTADAPPSYYSANFAAAVTDNSQQVSRVT